MSGLPRSCGAWGRRSYYHAYLVCLNDANEIATWYFVNMPYSIHRIRVATVNLQGQYNPPSYLDARVGVFAYLVRDAAGVLLIDTGVGFGNKYVDRTFEPDRTDLPEALMRFGVKTTDVTTIVNSHLHFDHCGGNHLFPNANVFVQARELTIARTTQHTVREWFDYEGARITAVSGDTEVKPGITLLHSPGHTPGHQSVLIETEKGRVLIAAQAAYTADEYRRGGDPESQAHDGLGDDYLRSITRLKSLAAAEVYFSHDDTCATASRAC